jgi:hypothetical protein
MSNQVYGPGLCLKPRVVKWFRVCPPVPWEVMRIGIGMNNWWSPMNEDQKLGDL